MVKKFQPVSQNIKLGGKYGAATKPSNFIFFRGGWPFIISSIPIFR
jgi:hypothetical protein